MAIILISPGVEKVQTTSAISNLYDTGSQAHDCNRPLKQHVLLQSPEMCTLCSTNLSLKLLPCGMALDTMSQIGGSLP